MYVPRFLACDIPVSCLCPADGFGLRLAIIGKRCSIPVLSCRRLFRLRCSRWISKTAFTLSFSCKSPPEWIFSHLFNQALLACSQTMNKHISTQMNAAKQARNEETRRRNMRVHNCQRSRFGFVARQLCGHHRNIYRQIEIWPPLAILARSPRDKFINLASRGKINVRNS